MVKRHIYIYIYFLIFFNFFSMCVVRDLTAHATLTKEIECTVVWGETPKKKVRGNVRIFKQKSINHPHPQCPLNH